MDILNSHFRYRLDPPKSIFKKRQVGDYVPKIKLIRLVTFQMLEDSEFSHISEAISENKANEIEVIQSQD